MHCNNIDEKNENIGLPIPMYSKNVTKNTSNISNITNQDTSCVGSFMIQALFIPMSSIDLQSSASNDLI